MTVFKKVFPWGNKTRYVKWGGRQLVPGYKHIQLSDHEKNGLERVKNYTKRVAFVCKKNTKQKMMT